MRCPHCKLEVPDAEKECPGCGLIFAKLRKKEEAEARTEEATPSTEASAATADPGSRLSKDLRPREAWPPLPKAELVRRLKIAAGISAAVAVFFSWGFRSYLPLPQGWVSLEKLWFPLSLFSFALHEGGHIVFGIPGNTFLTKAGGTLMELGMPLVCVFHFLRAKSPAGMGFCVFWLGTALIDVAFYAADAKLQAIILITGKSGREGGLHDWGYMLADLGLMDQCVGIGRMFFFLGCFLMAFPVAWAALAGWRYWKERPEGSAV